VPEVVAPFEYSTMLARIAREVAIDLHDIDTILKNNNIDRPQFDRIKQDPAFQRILEAEISAWAAAGNTYERTRLKAGAVIEEFLIEAHQRIHDKNETLSAKNELVKTLARIAGMGERSAGEAPLGSRFSVTINLGADHKLQIVKDVAPQVIDAAAEVVGEQD